MDMNLGKLQERMKDRETGVLQAMGSQSVGHNWVTEHTHININTMACKARVNSEETKWWEVSMFIFYQ